LTLLWTTLKEKFPNIFGEGAVFSDSEMRYLDLPKFQITYHDKTKVKSSDKSFPNGEKGNDVSVLQLVDCLVRKHILCLL
jgi:hypothetical protein